MMNGMKRHFLRGEVREAGQVAEHGGTFFNELDRQIPPPQHVFDELPLEHEQWGNLMTFSKSAGSLRKKGIVNSHDLLKTMQGEDVRSESSESSIAANYQEEADRAQ